MNRLLLGFAYFLIVTTPIQIAFCLWIFFFLMSPDYSFFSFSTSEFMDLTFLKYLKAWIYSWLWNDFLDVIWSLPAALMSLLKLIINTWLGIWLLNPKPKAIERTSKFIVHIMIFYSSRFGSYPFNG